MKIFVLDTNVLIHDPEAIFNFKENEIVIPIVVIEELDRLKKRQDGVGKNAREALKVIDKLNQQGSLNVGVRLKTDGILRVEVGKDYLPELPLGFEQNKPDNQVLSIALKLQERHKSVILVTKDINLRIKADALNIQAEDYEASKVDVNELFKGYNKIPVTTETLNEFYSKCYLEVKPEDFYPNQMVLLRNETTRQSALCKFNSKNSRLIPLFHQNATPWGITGRNLEQRFAIELLLSEDIKLVTLVGRAGTGKTLLALASGLQKVVEEKIYKRMIVARPIVPMGKDIGYLPGTKEEKLRNWMQPVTDNLELLFSRNSGSSYQYLVESKVIEIEALTYIRGRSLPNSYIIIDEAQNLTPHEIKTIITRAGEGTKIVLTGDPYQIDNQYLDESSNGLSYVAEKFREQQIAAHIVLKKGERSELATIAAEIL